jgi:NADH-quinone oxidoreductase subunit G
MNRCIQCYRCVRFYKDYAGGKDLDVFAAHNDVYFGRQEEGELESEFSGNLVEVCPTGVFTDKTLMKHYTRKWDLTNAPSVCHQCSLGCNIIASERYGTIRRVLSRYNGDVNGYFLCDRGRFGYEYVNSEKRIVKPVKLLNGSFAAITASDAVQEIRAIINTENKMIGIGSPKASLESNFMLRELVGAANFYAGVPAKEGELIRQVIEILRNGHIRTPSLHEVEQYDAVFILGEDVTNTAPMLALSLRQAAKNQPNDLASALKIPGWNDAGVREAVQGSTGPFFIATAHATKLDDIATQTYHARPDEIAGLGYSIAGQITKDAPSGKPDTETFLLADAIAKALLAARKPLIIAGTSLFNASIIQAAANLAYALQDQGKDAGLLYVVPEVNSIGSLMLTDQFLEEAIEKAGQDEARTLIVLENDLYQRVDKTVTDDFLKQFKQVITLGYLENTTTASSTLVLPAGTFAESDGTVINNEGRAQRFYQVHVPDNDARSSWKWLAEIMDDSKQSAAINLDEVMARMVALFPALQAIESIAPAAGFRENTQKIPRSPQRYSGRTAINAELHVSERRPPADPDSALSYTMEGYVGIPPPALTPFYWSPGWNSVQAINKYQIEVGGELHGGNPGKRLFEPATNNKTGYFKIIRVVNLAKDGEWLVLPLYHIFGSDELSAQGPAVAERVPQPYIALNDSDAAKAGIGEGAIIEIVLSGNKKWLPVKLKMGLPQGTAGLPKGFRETAGIAYPFFTTIKIAGYD